MHLHLHLHLPRHTLAALALLCCGLCALAAAAPSGGIQVLTVRVAGQGRPKKSDDGNPLCDSGASCKLFGDYTCTSLDGPDCGLVTRSPLEPDVEPQGSGSLAELMESILKQNAGKTGATLKLQGGGGGGGGGGGALFGAGPEEEDEEELLVDGEENEEDGVLLSPRAVGTEDGEEVDLEDVLEKEVVKLAADMLAAVRAQKHGGKRESGEGEDAAAERTAIKEALDLFGDAQVYALGEDGELHPIDLDDLAGDATVQPAGEDAEFEIELKQPMEPKDIEMWVDAYRTELRTTDLTDEEADVELHKYRAELATGKVRTGTRPAAAVTTDSESDEATRKEAVKKEATQKEATQKEATQKEAAKPKPKQSGRRRVTTNQR